MINGMQLRMMIRGLFKVLVKYYRIRFRYRCRDISLFPYNSIGDLVVLNAYFQDNSDLLPSMLLVPGNGTKIISNIMGNDKVMAVTEEEMKYLIVLAKIDSYKTIKVLHFNYDHITKNSESLCYHENISFFDCYYYFVFNKKLTKKPKYFIKKANNGLMDKNSVILFPKAKSIPPIKNEIWAGIVDKLSSYGIKTYTNCMEDEAPIKGSLPLVCSLVELREYASNVKCIISIRSGICDYLSDLDIMKIVLYPYEENTRLMDFYSLNNVPFVTNCFEYYCDNDIILEEIINKIITGT